MKDLKKLFFPLFFDIFQSQNEYLQKQNQQVKI